MSTIEIRKASITDLDTDVIVNAANKGLKAGGASRSSLITVSQLLTSPKAPEKRLPQLARLSLPCPLPEKPTQAHNAPHIAAFRGLRPCQKRTVSMPAKRLTSCGVQNIIYILGEAEKP